MYFIKRIYEYDRTYMKNKYVKQIKKIEDYFDFNN